MAKAKEFKPGRGYTKKDWDDVASPELTEEFFKTAKPFAEVFPELAVAIRKSRGPGKAAAKKLLSIRLDAEVIEAYRETGDGWQSRINADLRKARKLKKAG